MNLSFTRICLIVLLGVFALMLTRVAVLVEAFSITNFSNGLSDDDIIKAKQLWEMAIQAKGGRERLHKIESLMLAIPYPYGEGRTSYELDVFPNKRWEWIDERPSVFGLRSCVYNFDIRKELCDSSWDKPTTAIVDKYPYPLYYAQLIYLLETKMFQPQIISSSQTKIELKKNDEIDVKIGDELVSVLLDQKSHLPTRIVFYEGNDKKRLRYWHDLYNYREVEGVKIPHKVFYGVLPEKHFKLDITVELNPVYDPALFERNPVLSLGPDQWKKNVH